jgi:hypothetical protein
MASTEQDDSDKDINEANFTLGSDYDNDIDAANFSLGSDYDIDIDAANFSLGSDYDIDIDAANDDDEMEVEEEDSEDDQEGGVRRFTVERVSHRLIKKFNVRGKDYRIRFAEIDGDVDYLTAVQLVHRTLQGK